MTDDVYIDGVSLRSIGARAGDGFYDSLLTPAPFKDFASNDARTRDGVQILTSAPRVSSRDFTLTFIVFGDTPAEAARNRSALLALLAKVRIGMYVPAIMGDDETYWLVYTGKNVTLSTSLGLTLSKLTVKLTEPDPTSRSAAEWVKDIKD